MKPDMKQGRMVTQLRKIIGKSQSQFAAMLGVSKDTIISVENGRNQLSKSLAGKILISTGVSFTDNIWHKGLEDYTKTDFDEFRKEFYSPYNETISGRLSEVQSGVGIALRAAAKPGVAGVKDRLPAVYFSLLEWLKDIRKNFKLGPEMDEIVEDETRFIKRECEFVGTLKVDVDQAKEFADKVDLGHKALKKKLTNYRDRDLMMIKYESCDALFGHGRPKMAKLMQKPKYWFKKLPKEVVVEYDKPITAKELELRKNAIRPS